ncbi:prephenate dehydrogenase/arogenate dehydrogenase family protein [Candidatus Gracilibacteria bacterium]|nr:prephenate dehydrogenase/arogenate dehydrogenase family protein [Candidatus Gracilibacteria bacterium]
MQKLEQVNNITVIGGEGSFGRHLIPHLQSITAQVTSISQGDGEIEKSDKIGNADAIIISVPISHTVDVTRDLAGYALENKLVIDVSGLKSNTVPELERLVAAEKVSIHPMFLPNLESFQGKNILEVLDQGGEKWEEMKQFLLREGINFTAMTPQEHDVKMGYIQNVPHILTLLFNQTITSVGGDTNDLSKLSTPNVELLNLMTGRVLSNSGSTFGEMMMHNDALKDYILPMMQRKLAELSDIIYSGDMQGFNQLFGQLQSGLGEEFIKTGNTQSNTALAVLNTHKK